MISLIGFEIHGSLQVQPSLYMAMYIYTLSRRSLHGKGLQKYLKPNVEYIWIQEQHTSVAMNCNTDYQFGSVQELISALRDYQRMEVCYITDSMLESILWNKVPVSLQQEIKEITV